MADDIPKPNDTRIRRWLASQKYKNIVDNGKSDRGSLWVITGNNPPTESEKAFFDRVNAKHYDFRFVPEGSKATKGQPAWYWQPKPPRQT